MKCRRSLEEKSSVLVFGGGREAITPRNNDMFPRKIWDFGFITYKKCNPLSLELYNVLLAEVTEIPSKEKCLNWRLEKTNLYYKQLESYSIEGTKWNTIYMTTRMHRQVIISALWRLTSLGTNTHSCRVCNNKMILVYKVMCSILFHFMKKKI